MTAQTPDPALAGQGSGRDRHGDQSGLRSDPVRRYTFTAPVAVSRESIAERIAERVARAIVDERPRRVTDIYPELRAFFGPDDYVLTDVEFDAIAADLRGVPVTLPEPDAYTIPGADTWTDPAAHRRAYGAASTSESNVLPSRSAQGRRSVSVAAQRTET